MRYLRQERLDAPELQALDLQAELLQRRSQQLRALVAREVLV
jgi:hypothetical protein